MLAPTIDCVRRSFATVSVFALFVAIGTLLSPISAYAAPTFTVNSAADMIAGGSLTNGVCETAPGNGVCTLRAAIMKANHYPGGGVTIDLTAVPGGIVTLTIAPAGNDDESTGDLDINASMNIVGRGPANTIIDANHIDNAFLIWSTANATISGVTIRNGQAFLVGGIANLGTLSLINSTVSGNSHLLFKGGGGNGGGILNGGELRLLNSTVSGNSADGWGGGIHNAGGLILINSTVGGNTAWGTGGGGGLYNDSTGISILFSSTINSNVAVNDSGGGIANASGSVTLTNSTVSGNQAIVSGGGIANSFGTLTLTNSTVSSNNSWGGGGGIYNYLGTVNLFNATVTNNQADADSNGSGTGGGVFNVPTSTFNFQNSIIALNWETYFFLGSWHSTYGECTGTITSQGNSILNSYNTSNCTVTGSFTNGVDPNLGPLQDNGGLTQTHALMSGSPAIDTGNPGGCAGPSGVLTTDQRGATRPIGPKCDIGAYEYGATIPTFTVTGVASPPAGGSVLCSSPVISGGTSSCTITINLGYLLSGASSTCGGILSGTSFTAGLVTGNCTVTANFIRPFDLTPILELLLLD